MLCGDSRMCHSQGEHSPQRETRQRRRTGGEREKKLTIVSKTLPSPRTTNRHRHADLNTVVFANKHLGKNCYTPDTPPPAPSSQLRRSRSLHTTSSFASLMFDNPFTLLPNQSRPFSNSTPSLTSLFLCLQCWVC